MTGTVQDVQTGVIATGKKVIINDAVVMALRSSGSRVWISDAAAASANTGVEVYFGGADLPPIVPAVGQHLEVHGTIQEFGSAAGTITQIASPTIVISAAAPSSPVPVSGLTLATLLASNAAAEPYEGVLVQFSNLRLTSSSPNTLSDGTTSIRVGDKLTVPGDAVGTCYATVTGIWDWDTTNEVWVIAPTTNGLVTGGTCS